MGITLDSSIRLLEDYHKWEKKHDLDGNGVDDATKKLLEVAKKYQKIEQILSDWINDDFVGMSDYWMGRIKEVLEDGNE
jgi:hypothetical protein